MASNSRCTRKMTIAWASRRNVSKEEKDDLPKKMVCQLCLTVGGIYIVLRRKKKDSSERNSIRLFKRFMFQLKVVFP
jgi:hypothetical protein